MSTANAFIGQVFFLDGANNPAWLTYDPLNTCWYGALKNSSPAGLAQIYSAQGNFECKSADAGSYVDPSCNKVVTKEKITGKLTICIDSSIYNSLIAKQTGRPVNIVVIDRDSDQGDYVHQVIPYFSTAVKIGEVMVSEMSFEYEQAANILPATKRRRIFEIVDAKTVATAPGGVVT